MNTHAATAALEDALGPAVLSALAEEGVEDVAVGSDGTVAVRRPGGWRVEGRLGEGPRAAVLAYAAHLAGRVARPDRARLEAVLPGSGARLTGHLPPLSAGPCFTLRRPSPAARALADYVAAGALDPASAAILRDRLGGTVLVAGGNGSGKTTLLNALLAEPRFAGERMVVAEDTAELRVPATGLAERLLTDPLADPPVTLRCLVRDALRLRTERLVVGEVRGPEALDLVLAWGAGLAGLATLHATAPAGALPRLARLAALAGAAADPAAAAEAVATLVFVEERAGRRLARAYAVGPGGALDPLGPEPPAAGGTPCAA